MAILGLYLEPCVTSILRPSLEEVSDVILGTGVLGVRRVSPVRFELDDEAGRVEIEVEGEESAVERVVVRHPGGLRPGSKAARLCLEVAETLEWRARETGSTRHKKPADLLDPAVRPGARALRTRLLALALLVIVPSAVKWQLAGRRRDAWFVILVLGVFVYFALRAWGLLATRRRQ